MNDTMDQFVEESNELIHKISTLFEQGKYRTHVVYAVSHYFARISGDELIKVLDSKELTMLQNIIEPIEVRVEE